MKNLFLIAVVFGGMLLTGCSKDNDTKKDPGSFLRPGGDVVINGHDALH